MAVDNKFFLRPYMTVNHNLNMPILTDANYDGVSSIRKIFTASINFFVLLDTLFDQYSKGRSFGDDQLAVYRAIDSHMHLVGVHGKNCVLRFVCELQSRGKNEEISLAAILIKTIFTPRGTSIDKEFMKYSSAASKGKHGREHCRRAYGVDCPLSAFISDWI